jgi:hypothetical protein
MKQIKLLNINVLMSEAVSSVGRPYVQQIPLLRCGRHVQVEQQTVRDVDKVTVLCLYSECVFIVFGKKYFV